MRPDETILALAAAIANEAIKDARAGVAKYHPSNSGATLIGRPQIAKLMPERRRVGHGQWVRALYTGAWHLAKFDDVPRSSGD